MGAIVQGGAWNTRTSKQTSADLEVLKHQVNADYMIPIVLDASTVEPDTDGVRRLVAGTLLSKNSNNQYERYTGASAADEVDTLTVDATAGDYTIAADINGDTEVTDPIAFDAVAADIVTALEALANITTVTVTGTGPFTITVTDPADQDVTFTIDETGLTGTATIEKATTGDIDQTIRGVLATTHEFPDNLSHSDEPSQMWNHGQVFRSDRIVDWATHGTAARAALPTCRFD